MLQVGSSRYRLVGTIGAASQAGEWLESSGPKGTAGRMDLCSVAERQPDAFCSLGLCSLASRPPRARTMTATLRRSPPQVRVWPAG